MSHSVKDKNGTVLILVLWILSIITLIGGYFAVEARIGRNISGVEWRTLQAEAAARSVLTLVANRIAGPEAGEDDVAGSGLLIPDGRRYHLRYGGTDVWFSIEDESGKIDINSAPEETLRLLFQEVAGSDAIAQAIMDWRDKNSDPRPSGAESGYYRTLSPAYNCPNRPFDAVEELLMVKGVTPTLFWGPIPYPNGAGEGGWEGGLIDLLTIYNKTPRVSLRYAPLPVKAVMGDSGGGTGSKSGVFCLKMSYGGKKIRIYWTPEGGEGYKVLKWMEAAR